MQPITWVGHRFAPRIPGLSGPLTPPTVEPQGKAFGSPCVSIFQELGRLRSLLCLSGLAGPTSPLLASPGEALPESQGCCRARADGSLNLARPLVSWLSRVGAEP